MKQEIRNKKKKKISLAGVQKYVDSQHLLDCSGIPGPGRRTRRRVKKEIAMCFVHMDFLKYAILYLKPLVIWILALHVIIIFQIQTLHVTRLFTIGFR